MQSAVARVDHLVYAAPDLDAAVDRLERLLGVQAAPGGRHPGLGTRNAILGLGPQSYLEIIAPDLDPPASGVVRPFGIDDLDGPRLATWATRAAALDDLVRTAAARGVELGAVLDGSRRCPDGSLLEWRFTDPRRILAGGLVPFLIDWGASAHPAATAPEGATLVDLRAEHPEPWAVRASLASLAIDLAIAPGPRPALVAILRTSRGEIELR